MPEVMDVVPAEKEKELGNEVSLIEAKANGIAIVTDKDFEAAADAVKAVKAAQKKVDEYWEPIRESAYSAYKIVMAHKKEMSEPLKRAEQILKGKMSGYRIAQEKKRKQEEEKIRALMREEMQKKLAEAAIAEEKGDMFGADYAMAEAESLDTMAETTRIEKTAPKVEGLKQSKAWAIKSIDLSALPVEFAGVVIRPADERAIMRLIKATKGKIRIPGVEYEETVNFSVKVS